MLDAESTASPSVPPSSRESPGRRAQDSGEPSAGVGVEHLLFLTIKPEEIGRCVATYLWAGLAHVSVFGWSKYDDDIEVISGDEWPADADDYWSDARDLIAEYLNGSEGERRQLNARIAGEYLAAREAA